MNTTSFVYWYCRWCSLSTSLLFSRSVVSDSLRPHGMQRTTLLCPSQSPRACSDSCPLSQWCHPTISFSVIPFSSCLQSFPASGSFLMSQFFPSGDPSIGASASASVLPTNTQDWYTLGLTDLIFNKNIKEVTLNSSQCFLEGSRCCQSVPLLAMLA